MPIIIWTKHNYIYIYISKIHLINCKSYTSTSITMLLLLHLTSLNIYDPSVDDLAKKKKSN